MTSLLNSPVSRGSDEIKAAVDSAVRHLSSVHPWFWVQVVFKLAVYVVDDRLPAAEKHELGFSVWNNCMAYIAKVWQTSKTCGSRDARGGSCGNPYQLLLSTASPNPGVSTIVSSSWTPPSFIKTLDCSTCHRRGHLRLPHFILCSCSVRLKHHSCQVKVFRPLKVFKTSPLIDY